jgi:murein DD-endopeptidase MepM/ murein hydrolase activator NlpD
MRRLAVALAVLGIAGPALAGESPLARFEKVCGPMVKAINTGDYQAVRRDFNEMMAAAMSLEKTKAFFEGLKAQLGKIKKVESGRYVPPHTAVFPARFEGGAVLDIKIVLDGEGKIAGLWLLPHTTDIPVPKEHQTKLALPFRGRWHVVWGGDTKEQNQHHDVPNQRFAFDFVVTNENGISHKGEGKANQDYYAFGQEILAPAAGVVTDVIRGVRDNVPGSMNPYSALGNAVFIRHAEHEVSVLAHLKLGSIRVSVGQKLRAGQVIGLCGNSGNSSEPHLHYHLMNTPLIQDGTGIKVFFEDVVVEKDGQPATAPTGRPWGIPPA